MKKIYFMLVCCIMLFLGNGVLAQAKTKEYTTGNLDTAYVFEIVDNNIVLKAAPKTEGFNRVALYLCLDNESMDTVVDRVMVNPDELPATYYLGTLADGKYKLEVNLGDIVYNEKNGSLISYHERGLYRSDSAFSLSVEKGELNFEYATNYKQNSKYFITETPSAKELSYYLTLQTTKATHIEKLRKQAQDIVKGETNDYEKLKLIHAWVATNIYYDYDALSSVDGYPPQTPYTVLTTKKAVCDGYSQLTADLLRLVGIPARYIGGMVTFSDEGHAWNEAYVDGRWILLDTTWDSANIYSDGQYIQEVKNHAYFDTSLASFSNQHIYTERSDSSYQYYLELQKDFATTSLEDTKISLNRSTLKLNSKTSTAKFSFIGFLTTWYDYVNVTYKTSNSKVATVSKTGKITAKKKGTATIKVTLKSEYGTKVKTYKITVK